MTSRRLKRRRFYERWREKKKVYREPAQSKKSRLYNANKRNTFSVHKPYLYKNRVKKKTRHMHQSFDTAFR
jgi:hypothetical protein